VLGIPGDRCSNIVDHVANIDRHEMPHISNSPRAIGALPSGLEIRHEPHEAFVLMILVMAVE
jgi:hypothetical protein